MDNNEKVQSLVTKTLDFIEKCIDANNISDARDAAELAKELQKIQ